jgi:beta-lactam-binding protein with PASTA domain
VKVPRLIGLKTGDADRVLGAGGLLLSVEPTDEDGDGTIVSQSPIPGTNVERGTVVTVRARCVPAPCPMPAEGAEIYDPCTCAAR